MLSKKTIGLSENQIGSERKRARDGSRRRSSGAFRIGRHDLRWPQSTRFSSLSSFCTSSIRFFQSQTWNRMKLTWLGFLIWLNLRMLDINGEEEIHSDWILVPPFSWYDFVSEISWGNQRALLRKHCELDGFGKRWRDYR